MARLAPEVIATITLVCAAFLLLSLFLLFRFYVLRDSSSEDTEWLLGSQQSENTSSHGRSPFENIAEVLAALNTGKYPSQDQINNALRRLLKSSVLSPDTLAATLGARQSGGLSVAGRRLIEHVREIVEAVLQIGLEKNSDLSLFSVKLFIVRARADLKLIQYLGDDVIQRCLHEFVGSNVVSPAFRPELNLSANPDGGASAIGLLFRLFITFYEAD